MALNNIASPRIIITANDDQLQRKIFEKARAIGRAFAAEFKDQMVLLFREVINLTPPSGGANRSGRSAQQSGQGAIMRDLSLMGFVPVQIKGVRTISHVPAGNVPGRKAVQISPVTVKTKLNPIFADPDAFHAQRIRRLAAKRATTRGRFAKASRGGSQAFYVAKGKFSSMRNRLFKEIGTLAAPWLPSLRRLNGGDLPYWVPAFIKRHESDTSGRARGSMNLDPNANNGVLFVRFTNSMPDTAAEEADETQRRVETAKQYRINAIRRGLEGRAKRIARAS